MASQTQRQASCAVLVVALLLSAPAHAAIVVGPGGKPVQRATPWNPLIVQEQDGACRGLRDKRAVAFNLASQMTLVDAVAWISSVVCKPFLLPGTIAIENKTLTMVAPERMTPEEAYRLFLSALDSVGLTVERVGQLQRIAEIATAFPITGEIGGAEARTADPDSYVTALVHLQDLTPEERALVFETFNAEPCDCVMFAPDPDTVVITDRRSKIERLLHRNIGR